MGMEMKGRKARKGGEEKGIRGCEKNKGKGKGSDGRVSNMND